MSVIFSKSFQGPPGINNTFNIFINLDQVVPAMWDLRHSLFLPQTFNWESKAFILNEKGTKWLSMGRFWA